MEMKAKLILHRKTDEKKECLCGAKLKMIGGKWVCPIQYRKKEPNTISLNRDRRNTIKKAEEVILYYMPK